MSGLRAAIVGAGLMGRWHAHYAGRAGAEVAAIVDPNPTRAAALGRQWSKARVFADLAQCLASCPTDVVHVCTPVDGHEPAAETALRAGKPVLVEKPLAASAPAAQKLIRLAHSKQLKLNPVHQFPFQRAFRRLCQRREELGDLVRVAFHLCSSGGAGRTDAGCRALLLEILPHPLSLFFSLWGREFTQSSWSILRFTASELEMSGGLNDTLLEIRLSLRGRPPRNELTVVGTKRSGHVDFFHGYAVVESGGVSRPAKLLRPFRSGLSLLAAAGANLMRRARRREFAYPGLGELIDSFYRSIQEDGAAPIGDEEILEIASFIDRVSWAGRGPASLGAAWTAVTPTSVFSGIKPQAALVPEATAPAISNNATPGQS